MTKKALLYAFVFLVIAVLIACAPAPTPSPGDFTGPTSNETGASSNVSGAILFVVLLIIVAAVFVVRRSKKSLDDPPVTIHKNEPVGHPPTSDPRKSKTTPSLAGTGEKPKKQSRKAGTPSHIFISYRRGDSADIAGRIYDRLVGKFGRIPIFKDVDSIPLGLDFKEYLDAKVSECSVLLAIIGDHWLEARDEAGNERLNDPTDFVRIEIESALARGIPVIPLLVRGARMPSEKNLPNGLKKLVYRNGIPIRSDPDFHRDMDRLIAALEKYIS